MTAARIFRFSFTILVLASALPMGGCRICADCEDLAYPAYGGAWQRIDRESGRVGSLFDPGGARAAELTDRDEPINPDEVERNRGQRRDAAEDPEQLELDERSIEEDERSLRERAKELRERQLDDIESGDDEELRKRELDDIEVRIIPRRAPIMVNTD